MNNLFDANNALIEKCKNEISKFNEFGFKSISISDTSIKNTKYKNDLSDLFNLYISQKQFTSSIFEIIDSLEYSIDDLSMAIDRSTDSITQIYSAMNERIALVKEYATRISNNLTAIAETVPSFESSYLSQLYEYMENIEFIPMGYEIIKKMAISDPSKLYSMNESLKHKLFNVDQDTNRFNKLQTFNIVPDDGEPLKLMDALECLFNIKLSDHKSDLKQILKLITADTGVETGLIIHTSSNDDKYFDLTSLLNRKLPTVVNTSMIEAYNIIKNRKKSKKLKDELISINVSQDNGLVFVLWTHDMEYFKIRKTPLVGKDIKLLLRQSPSKLIESINLSFESEILKKMENRGDLINYKNTKYMSFREGVDEKTFLTKLKKNIMTNIKNNKNTFRAVLNACDSSKIELGILTPHAKLIYASMATKISIAIDKHIAINKKISDYDMDMILFSNDNIYSRTMASVYLEQS